MIVLRNLMLAIAAFFVAGAGFYSYLLNALPPDQVQARASAPPTQASTAPATEGSSSGWSLAAAVMGDFLAARREVAPAIDDVNETPPAPVVVPEWLNERFDQTADAHDKVITAEEKQGLLSTLLELRVLQQQHMATQAASQGGEEGGRNQIPLGLTARAMQAELQFRQTLGIGLAEFMKQMAPADLARLLAIPLPDASPTADSQMGQTQASAGVTLVR